MIFFKIIDHHQVPEDLLLLADESSSQIDKYRTTAQFRAAYENEKIVGMIGLLAHSLSVAEIVTLAVYEKYENRKIGTQLIEEVLAYAKEKGFGELLVKTGDCGMKQLFLYQRCGFRFDSINKDYFTKYYDAPMYENGLQLRDQIVMKYTVYSQEELERITGEYWNRFIKKHPEYRNETYEAWGFCYGEYLPNRLLGLVREGKKTGTCSALALYEKGEKIPEEGDISILTPGNGLPGCIIKTVELRIKKFREINEEEARMEGEGDLSLDYWRKAHTHVFNREYREKGLEFNEDIPILYERFILLFNEEWKEK